MRKTPFPMAPKVSERKALAQMPARLTKGNQENRKRPAHVAPTEWLDFPYARKDPKIPPCKSLWPDQRKSSRIPPNITRLTGCPESTRGQKQMAPGSNRQHPNLGHRMRRNPHPRQPKPNKNKTTRPTPAPSEAASRYRCCCKFSPPQPGQ